MRARMDSGLVIRGKRIILVVLLQIQKVTDEHLTKAGHSFPGSCADFWTGDEQMEQPKTKSVGSCCSSCRKNNWFHYLQPIAGSPIIPTGPIISLPPTSIWTDPVPVSVREFLGIKLRMVRRSTDDELLNYLMYRYNYKRYRIFVGALAWITVNVTQPNYLPG